MRFMNEPHTHGPHGHGPHGHDRQRARRGAIRGAIMQLLAERPMHGYELIGELEERTGGRWRPSPGSVYPTLAALEDEGLVRAVEDDGRKRYELTDEGRSWLAEHADDRQGPPWGREGFGGPGGFGGRGDMRRLSGEIFGQLRQLGRFGSTAQRDQATAILSRTRDELYAVLAQPRAEPAADATTESETGSGTDES
jgi:DNA-binding PadR family transcriptional regulator